MTNEEYVEELLWNAHTKGNHSEVLELAKNLTFENPKLSFFESVYNAVTILENEEVTVI